MDSSKIFQNINQESVNYRVIYRER